MEQRDQLRDELLAVNAARRELSPDDERYLLESFLDRLERQFDARIDARVKEEIARQPRRRSGMPPWVVPAALGASIPIVAIAGAFAHGWGILIALVFVISVIGIYAGSSQS